MRVDRVDRRRVQQQRSRPARPNERRAVPPEGPRPYGRHQRFEVESCTDATQSTRPAPYGFCIGSRCDAEARWLTRRSDRRPGGRTATLTSPMTAEVRSTRTTASVETSARIAHGPNGDFRTSPAASVICEPCRKTDSQRRLKELFDVHVQRTQDSIEFTFIDCVDW